jgi:hypothetical protein
MVTFVATTPSTASAITCHPTARTLLPSPPCNHHGHASRHASRRLNSSSRTFYLRPLVTWSLSTWSLTLGLSLLGRVTWSTVPRPAVLPTAHLPVYGSLPPIASLPPVVLCAISSASCHYHDTTTLCLPLPRHDPLPPPMPLNSTASANAQPNTTTDRSACLLARPLAWQLYTMLHSH